MLYEIFKFVLFDIVVFLFYPLAYAPLNDFILSFEELFWFCEELAIDTDAPNFPIAGTLDDYDPTFYGAVSIFLIDLVLSILIDKTCF